jgi:hypothetical protein
VSSPFYIASIVDGSISQYIEQVGRNAAAELSTEACLQLLAHIFAIHVAHLTTGMRVGAKAVERLSVVKKSRAVHFYHDYPQVWNFSSCLCLKEEHKISPMYCTNVLVTSRSNHLILLTCSICYLRGAHCQVCQAPAACFVNPHHMSSS